MNTITPPTPEHQAQVDDARAARTDGLETVEYGSDPRLILTIDAAINEANASGREWSANDIRDRFPVVSPGLVGNRVRSAMMRRKMVQVGETPSTLANTHAKNIMVWIGAQHAASDRVTPCPECGRRLTDGRHRWLEQVVDAWRAADHAWWLAREAAAIGYATEEAEYAAKHPRPRLADFMVQLSPGQSPEDALSDHQPERRSA